jgi:hypothetical protein
VIRSGKCAVFIGSGLSVGNYLSWLDLVNALCDVCGVAPVTRDSPEDKLLQATQDAKSNNQEAYYEFLGGHFGRAVESIPTIYHVLLSLPFDSYLTVNFDPLLATGARTARNGCKLPPHAYPELDRKNAGGRSIHHLHGFVSQDRTLVDGDVVLAKSEFEEAYSANSNLMNFLVPTIENEPILFVGCRLREPTMKHVFEICKEHQRKRKQRIAVVGAPPSEPPPRFIVLRQPHVTGRNGKRDVAHSHEEKRELQEYYERFDIQPVWYDGRGDDHSALLLAFEQLADLPDVRPEYGWPGSEV